jgi:hypothetical protein
LSEDFPIVENKQRIHGSIESRDRSSLRRYVEIENHTTLSPSTIARAILTTNCFLGEGQIGEGNKTIRDIASHYSRTGPEWATSERKMIERDARKQDGKEERGSRILEEENWDRKIMKRLTANIGE